MKRLIPAIALLLISAVLISTASYAWFTINTSVEATNMRVEATTSKNLVISHTGVDGTFKETAKAADDLAKDALFPVSTADLITWHSTTADGQKKIDFQTGQIKGDADPFESGDFADVTVSGGGNYYYVADFYIKVAGVDTDEFANLYVSDITVSGLALDISHSLRVGVRVYEADNAEADLSLIYSPSGDFGTTLKAVTDVDGSTTDISNVYNTPGSSISLGAVTTDAIKVTVYLWYEGQDSQNTSENAIASEELTVVLNFLAA